MWPRDVGERAAVAGEREAGVEGVDDVERVQELADRVGRVADVEVLRDAAEQVVAGDQQAPLGLVQADVRGRVAGRLDDLPGAEVGLDRRRRGRGRGRRAASPPGRVPERAAALGPAPQRLVRHAALQRDLERLRRARLGSLGVERCQAGCIQTSRPARAAIGAAWPQWSAWAWVHTSSRTSLEPRPACSSARSRLPIEPRLVHAGVDEHDAVAGLQRPGVAVRDAGQRSGSRSRQMPGQHALAAAHVTRVVSACAIARRHATVPAMAKKGRRREKLRAPESEYRDGHGTCSCCAAR